MAEAVSARRVQTQEKLIDAAIGVFADRGVLGASVEEICEAAGFTRGAFYSNFDTKNDLCLAILERQASRQLAAAGAAIEAMGGVDAVASGAGSVGHSLDDLVEQALRVFMAGQGDRVTALATVELRLYAVREESLRPGYLAFLERVGSEFALLLDRAAASFGYRLNVPTPQAITALQGVLEIGILNGMIRSQPESHDQVALLGGVLRSLLVPA